jgi:hypothetical protein
MRFPRLAFALACIAVLVPAAAASAERSVGTRGQIAWVRSAASRFVTAELSGNGEAACAVLNAPLRVSVHGRTCAERWDARITALLRRPGARSALRLQARAIPATAVIVHGNVARLALATPLLAGPNHFLWTENCWMLED